MRTAGALWQVSNRLALDDCETDPDFANYPSQSAVDNFRQCSFFNRDEEKFVGCKLVQL
jgi:hypothetical protein